jgi:hypothetical protein
MLTFSYSSDGFIHQINVHCSNCDHVSPGKPRNNEEWLRYYGNHEFWVVDEKEFICYQCIGKYPIRSHKRPFWKLPINVHLRYMKKARDPNPDNLRKYLYIWEDCWIEHYNSLSDFQKEWEVNRIMRS